MSNLVKISALFLSFCAACGLALAAEEPEMPAAQPAVASKAVADSEKTEVAVTVNGAAITEADIDARIKPQIDRWGSQMAPNYLNQMKKRLKKQALEGMIIEKILSEKVKQAGINVTNKDVDDKLKEIAAQQGSTVEKIKGMMQAQGQDFNQVKEQIKKGLRYEMFMKTQWAGKIDVNEAEAKEYYEQNKKQSETPEQVKASHILIKTDRSASDEDKQKARAKAEDLLKQVKDGGDFAALAKEHSDCPSSSKGGDLGLFKRGQMVKAFEDAAFALEPGQVSDVVETQFGYHIIKVTEKTQAGSTPFEEAKEKITQMLTQKKQTEFYKGYVEKLKAEADIVYPPGKEPIPDAPAAQNPMVQPAPASK